MKKFEYTTKRGLYMRVEELRSGKFLAQLSGTILDPHKSGHVTTTDHVLDHYDTIEDALSAVGWTWEILGIPTLV